MSLSVTYLALVKGIRFTTRLLCFLLRLRHPNGQRPNRQAQAQDCRDDIFKPRSPCAVRPTAELYSQPIRRRASSPKSSSRGTRARMTDGSWPNGGSLLQCFMISRMQAIHHPSSVRSVLELDNAVSA